MDANNQPVETAIDEYEDYPDVIDETPIDEYDITAVPSDFTVMTLKDLVDRQWLCIPGFQRHFVWDLSRASKLIESLILGLPVPQLFLYEQERNKNLLIDGQQRLMSIYYFLRERFPRKNRRADLRRIYSERNGIPDEIFNDDKYFRNFKLQLPESYPGQRNRLRGLTYSALGEDYKSRLDLRPIRCIFVRQNAPSDDDSSIYEIFNRLNTGGITLHAQEIRTSIHQSEFYDMLNRVNSCDGWRNFLPSSALDLHMKDVEVLLRGFAMLIDGKNYRPSMIRFLNNFSRKCKYNTPETNLYLEKLFASFLKSASNLTPGVFTNKANNKFNIALYEAVFAAVCGKSYDAQTLLDCQIIENTIEILRADQNFLATSQQGTASSSNVGTRLERARQIIQTSQSS